MRYSYDVVVRCREGPLRCLRCARKDKGLKTEEVAQGVKIAECLRIIIGVIATVWFIRNQFCRIQIYRFNVESPGWPCTAMFVDKEQRFFFTK